MYYIFYIHCIIFCIFYILYILYFFHFIFFIIYILIIYIVYFIRFNIVSCLIQCTDWGYQIILSRLFGQGCPLSPYLFLLAMTCVESDMKERCSGHVPTPECREWISMLFFWLMTPFYFPQSLRVKRTFEAY